MRRSERADDRWSGHISLPGGHAHERDADLVATALRETEEEVGLVLIRERDLVGALDPVQARARGRRLATTIAPLVFAPPGPLEPTPGPEAAALLWLPLALAASGELDGVHALRDRSGAREFPCWRYAGEVVWGLTYHILADFLRRAGPVRP